ncbi:MAG TPA: hypothetical protein VH207_02120 [Chthoniobacterales bacterium]|jgi:hypothetical protein|nr:hypothetical protein [Chthoniobacterales bacterium]
MNTEQLLDRIFRLARRAPPPATPAPAFGLETAVLAHWRAAAAESSPNGGLLRGLRWAALAACAIALLTAALKRDELAAFNRRSDPVARVADSAIVVGYGYE